MVGSKRKSERSSQVYCLPSHLDQPVQTIAPAEFHPQGRMVLRTEY